MKRHLTEGELTLLENALRLARDEYKKLAVADPTEAYPRLAKQFEQQALDTEKLREPG